MDIKERIATSFINIITAVIITLNFTIWWKNSLTNGVLFTSCGLLLILSVILNALCDE